MGQGLLKTFQEMIGIDLEKQGIQDLSFVSFVLSMSLPNLCHIVVVVVVLIAGVGT